MYDVTPRVEIDAQGGWSEYQAHRLAYTRNVPVEPVVSASDRDLHYSPMHVCKPQTTSGVETREIIGRVHGTLMKHFCRRLRMMRVLFTVAN